MNKYKWDLRGIFLDIAPANLFISPQMVILFFGLSQGLLQLDFEQYESLPRKQAPLNL
jgi:hypothetical protein